MTDEVIEGEARYLPAVPDAAVIPFLAVKDGKLNVKNHPVVKALLGKTPDGVKQTRPGPGGRTFTYAPWAYYARKLTETFGPTWGMRITNVAERELPKAKPSEQPKVEIIVSIILTTPYGEMPATGSAIYYPNNKEGNYGDVIQSAQSYALRRAASRWGIGLDLYADTEEDLPDLDLKDAQAAFRSSCKQLGITEKDAIGLLSERLSGDSSTLPTLEDCVEAAIGTGADAYWSLIVLLKGEE